MADLKAMAEQLVSLTIKEANELAGITELSQLLLQLQLPQHLLLAVQAMPLLRKPSSTLS